jgi:hypothetical protein
MLSGTLAAPGTYNFTITATDANAATGSQSYTLTIAVAAPTAPVPMLGRWAMWLLAGLLGAATIVRRRGAGKST